MLVVEGFQKFAGIHNPDKPEPKRNWLVREITNYKSQITNKEEPFGQILYAFGDEHEMVSFIKPDRAVCNFEHCNLEFVCNLYFVFCIFFKSCNFLAKLYNKVTIGISRIFESLMPQQISANRRKNRSIQV